MVAPILSDAAVLPAPTMQQARSTGGAAMDFSAAWRQASADAGAGGKASASKQLATTQANVPAITSAHAAQDAPAASAVSSPSGEEQRADMQTGTGAESGAAGQQQQSATGVAARVASDNAVGVRAAGQAAGACTRPPALEAVAPGIAETIDPATPTDDPASTRPALDETVPSDAGKKMEAKQPGEGEADAATPASAPPAALPNPSSATSGAGPAPAAAQVTAARSKAVEHHAREAEATAADEEDLSTPASAEAAGTVQPLTVALLEQVPALSQALNAPAGANVDASSQTPRDSAPGAEPVPSAASALQAPASSVTAMRGTFSPLRQMPTGSQPEARAASAPSTVLSRNGASAAAVAAASGETATATVPQEDTTAVTAAAGSEAPVRNAKGTPTAALKEGAAGRGDEARTGAASAVDAPKELTLKKAGKATAAAGTHATVGDTSQVQADPGVAVATPSSTHGAPTHAASADSAGPAGSTVAMAFPASSGVVTAHGTLPAAVAGSVAGSTLGTSTTHLGESARMETIGIGTGLRAEVSQMQAAGDAGSRSSGLEVGFHDGTLGWLSVRATADAAGGLHAAVNARTAGAAAAVDSMLPALGRFLQESNVGLHSISSAQAAAGTASTAAPATLNLALSAAQYGGATGYGAGTGAGAGGGNAGSAPQGQQDGRDGSSRQPVQSVTDRTSEADGTGTAEGFVPARYAGTERVSRVSLRI